MSDNTAFRFMIEPHSYAIIGDSDVISDITTMTDENPYDDTQPTEPNPDRTQMIDKERLEEMYDGEPPYQDWLGASEQVEEGETLLMDGQVVSDDKSDCDGGESE